MRRNGAMFEAVRIYDRNRAAVGAHSIRQLSMPRPRGRRSRRKARLPGSSLEGELLPLLRLPFRRFRHREAPLQDSRSGNISPGCKRLGSRRLGLHRGFANKRCCNTAAHCLRGEFFGYEQRNPTPGWDLVWRCDKPRRSIRPRQESRKQLGMIETSPRLWVWATQGEPRRHAPS